MPWLILDSSVDLDTIDVNAEITYVAELHSVFVNNIRISDFSVKFLHDLIQRLNVKPSKGAKRTDLLACINNYYQLKNNSTTPPDVIPVLQPDLTSAVHAGPDGMHLPDSISAYPVIKSTNTAGVISVSNLIQRDASIVPTPAEQPNYFATLLFGKNPENVSASIAATSVLETNLNVNVVDGNESPIHNYYTESGMDDSMFNADDNQSPPIFFDSQDLHTPWSHNTLAQDEFDKIQQNGYALPSPGVIPEIFLSCLLQQRILWAFDDKLIIPSTFVDYFSLTVCKERGVSYFGTKSTQYLLLNKREGGKVFNKNPKVFSSQQLDKLARAEKAIFLFQFEDKDYMCVMVGTFPSDGPAVPSIHVLDSSGHHEYHDSCLEVIRDLLDYVLQGYGSGNDICTNICEWKLIYVTPSLPRQESCSGKKSYTINF